MKIKTTELTGVALDWAVAKCEELALVGMCLFTKDPDEEQILYTPSTDWSQGGPIIERAQINITTLRKSKTAMEWKADVVPWQATLQQFADTPLIAAMRCYVTSKLGDEVEVPEKLL